MHLERKKFTKQHSEVCRVFNSKSEFYDFSILLTDLSNIVVFEMVYNSFDIYVYFKEAKFISERNCFLGNWQIVSNTNFKSIQSS